MLACAVNNIDLSKELTQEIAVHIPGVSLTDTSFQNRCFSPVGFFASGLNTRDAARRAANAFFRSMRSSVSLCGFVGAGGGGPGVDGCATGVADLGIDEWIQRRLIALVDCAWA